MAYYNLRKIGKSDNPLADLSDFGDSAPSFSGSSLEDPKVGKRFNLYDGRGQIVISTSPVVKVEKGVLYTTYSVYSFEKTNEEL